MQTHTPAPPYPHAPSPARRTSHATPRAARAVPGHGLRIDRAGEFLPGAAVSAFGISFACGARTFDLGFGGHWGPFYLPLLAGLLIAFAGNLLILKSLSIWRPAPNPAHTGCGGRTGRAAVRALLTIMGSTAVFATAVGGLADMGLPTIGLLGGIYIAGFTAWLGSEGVRPLTFVSLAAALGIGSYVAFGVALDLSLPVWPTFVGR